MNNNCPECDVLYNVAPKDVGRRLKCKKCGTPLTVTAAGLVRDEAPPEPEFDEEPRPRKRRRGDLDPLAALAAVGGVPGVLFGAGVVLVLLFTFLQALAAASNQRAAEYPKQLALEEEIEVRELLPPDKRDRADLEPAKQSEYDEKKKKIEDRYYLKKKVADEDRRATEIANTRSRVLEGYGAMFGFMLVGFGCLGFLRAQDALLLRIVAGVILTGMVLGLFRVALGTGAGVGATVNLG